MGRFMPVPYAFGKKRSVSGIRDKHPGSAALHKLYVFFLLYIVSCSGHFLHERVLLPVLPGLARTARRQVRHRLQEGGYRTVLTLDTGYRVLALFSFCFFFVWIFSWIKGTVSWEKFQKFWSGAQVLKNSNILKSILESRNIFIESITSIDIVSGKSGSVSVSRMVKLLPGKERTS